jgi:hypothetical protein
MDEKIFIPILFFICISVIQAGFIPGVVLHYIVLPFFASIILIWSVIAPLLTPEDKQTKIIEQKKSTPSHPL